MFNFGPTVPAQGPCPAKVCILSEHPDAHSLISGEYELRRMLQTVGINLNDCFRISVFSRQPNGNNLALFGTDDVSKQYRQLGPLTNAPLTYMDTAYCNELERLYAELAVSAPNIVIALGPAATWALGLGTGIKALRGSVHTTTIPGLPRAVKVVPTYPPSIILRQWDLRVVALADLEKAHVESRSSDFKFDNSELWISPTLTDLLDFDNRHMERAHVCAADIETKRGQITCISFAPTTDISLVIPFWQEGPNPNYWLDAPSESSAWAFVRKWMERENLVKVFQNGLYDLAYLRAYCAPKACSEDTMLLHHSLFSELQKGLGFLGSVYANVPSWKKMRTVKREELLKAND